MSGVSTRLLGRWGEALIADALRRKGYRILAAGYQCRFGEIDLIAADDKYIIFTEVKLRKNDHFAPGRVFVDARKQARIRTTAEIYLMENPTLLQPRFDVAEVYAQQGMETKNPRIVYFPNAF
ncbi:MAG: YraN family protein [Pseudoflavonifractor sp.]